MVDFRGGRIWWCRRGIVRYGQTRLLNNPITTSKFRLTGMLSGIPVTNLHSPFGPERRRLDAITGQQSQAPVAERVTLRSRLQKSGGSHGLFQINFQSL